MSAPRLVLVHRRTQLEELLAEHSTLGAVEFFLAARGERVQPLLVADEAQRRALELAAAAVPSDWRQAVVERGQLSRFLFEPDDLVVVVGQDGLVPNVSKYLDGQRVFGISPGVPGLLCSHRAEDLAGVVSGAVGTRVSARAMAEARVDDGQRLTALNELFLGDRGHQSARYALEVGQGREEQSSSGLVVGTGTGATGWLASLWRQARPGFELPAADADGLAWFVREAWPSAATGASVVAGLLGPGEELRLRARGSLVVFGDGMERDHLRLGWGQEVTISRSERQLQLLRLA
ncbi:NAD(+)/NADH kinase [Tessaracoccus terricola]